jgi:alkylhydroperoxidase family enzyme
MSTSMTFNVGVLSCLPDRLRPLIGFHPRIGPQFAALYTQVMLASGALSDRERSIIGAVAAIAQDSTFLAETHLELSGEGQDSDLIRSIKHRRWSEVIGASARSLAICILADKLSATPTRVTPEDWQPLISCGIDQLGLIEFAFVVGLTNYMTRIAAGFGAPKRSWMTAPAMADNVGQSRTGASTIPGEAATGTEDEAAGEMRSLGWFLNLRVPPPPADSPYNFGYRSEMGALLGAHPRIGPAFWALFSEIMFAPGALTRAEREMVAAVAAAAQDCHY